MAEIRTPEPQILVDSWGGRFILRIRPCPDGFATLKGFATHGEAFDHAQQLQTEHGWPITVDFIDPARLR